jgi:hypothetical protein
VRSWYLGDGSYLIRIAFDENTKWSKSKFQPEHFLDPRTVRPRKMASKLVMFAGTFRRVGIYDFQPTASSASFAALAVLM